MHISTEAEAPELSVLPHLLATIEYLNPKCAVLDSFNYKREHLDQFHTGPNAEPVLTPICLLGLERRWFLPFLERSGFAFNVKMCSGTNIA